MKVFNRLVFDETISGTDTWYTPDGENSLLGGPDIVDFMVHASNVTGTSPTLTVAAEDSADGRHWHEISIFVPGANLDSDKLFRGIIGGFPTNLSLVRVRMSLGGTDPQCRLKVYATGRIT